MPIFIPEILNTINKGELLVAELLKKQLDDEWIVCHSHEILVRKNKLGLGELDFILFHAQKGLFMLEVKGGTVTYDNSKGWLQHSKTESHTIQPVTQLRNNIDKLLIQMNKYLETNLKIAFGQAVIVPECHFTSELPPGCTYGDPDPNAMNTIIWDDRYLDNLDDQIQRCLALWAGKFKTQIDETLSKKMQQYFRFSTLHASRSMQVETLQNDLLISKATEQQINAFTFLKDWSRFRVEGVTGSGKTMLAMKLALSKINESKRTLVLCYNKHLSWWIRSIYECTSGDPFETNNITVINYHELCKQFCDKASIIFDPDSADDFNDFWNNTTADLLLEALENLPEERYDCVIVDEAQDIKVNWWTSIEYLLRTPDSTLGVFYDPNQNIFKTKMEIPIESQAIKLTTNCRNPKPIFDLMKPLYEETSSAEELKEGPEVVIKKMSAKSITDYLSETIHDLINSGINNRQIVILGKHTKRNSSVKNLSTICDIPLDADFDEWLNNKSILYSSIMAFKGIEAEYVFLIDVTDFNEKFTQQEYINGISRCRHQLTIIKT